MSLTPGSWTTLTLAGKQVDCYAPRNARPTPRAVIHLHGHSGQTIKDNPPFTVELERHSLHAFCPHGARSWWGWRICKEFDPHITPEQYLLQHLLPTLAEQFQLAPPALALIGISMGGQGALRLAYRQPRIFPVVAALAPAIDFYQWHGQGLPLDEMYATRESARQESATLEIHPLNWPRHQWIACDPTDVEWYEGTERLISKLSSIGIPYSADLHTSHGGHSWDYFNHMAPTLFQFLQEKLEEESQRFE